jgi:hypothetical protein
MVPEFPELVAAVAEANVVVCWQPHWLPNRLTRPVWQREGIYKAILPCFNESPRPMA